MKRIKQIFSLEANDVTGQVWFFVLFIFILALSVRLTLVFMGGMQGIGKGAESVNIAISLLSNGTYADAYGVNIGPTAHCLPLHPLIVAGLLKLFGQDFGGGLALRVMASSAAALGYALMPVVATVWRMGLLPGVASGLLGALLPLNFWGQTCGVFDAPLTFLALTILCCMLGRYWSARSFTVRGGLGVGVVAGLACLLNSAILPVLCVWGGTGIWRFSEQRRAFLRFIAAMASVVVLLQAPWGIRNLFVLGGMVWTRSNFGLELHLSNNDHATASAEENVRTRWFAVEHPTLSEVERQKVRALGELRYHAEKRAQALQWIRSNPRRFMRLSLERMGYFWFPPMLRWWQTAFEAMITLGGLGGLIVLARRRNDAFWAIGAIFTSYSAIYMIIQVSPRYRFPVEPFLLLLSCYLITTLRSGEKHDSLVASCGGKAE